jgi:uncharacterized membrane protein
MLRPPSPRSSVVCLLVATLGLGGVLARPAAAADWTVQTAANRFGAGRESFGYTINPGGRVHDGIVVANPGSTPLHITLQAVKAVSAWVHLSRDDVTVGPGGAGEVKFALTLPKGAAPGDYAGGIVASSADGRAGIPLRLRVGGALRPSLAVERVRVHFSGSIGKGDATVTYTVHNTGNAILSAHQTVSVSGPFGRWKVAGDRVANTPPLLPGESRKVSVPLHGVTPALRLTAAVTLVPLLTDAAGSTAPLAATKASGHALIVPWSLLAVILVLCALGVAFTQRRRRSSLATGIAA